MFDLNMYKHAYPPMTKAGTDWFIYLMERILETKGIRSLLKKEKEDY